jgi:GNAT superfamily N-acetyltransferase
VTPGVTLRTDHGPADLAAVVALHRECYATEWGFDERFAAHVEAPLSAFAAAGSPRERLWLAEEEGRLVGCVAIVAAAPETSQLRWFLVAPRARGAGLGQRLLGAALDFSRDQGYRRVMLWTVDLLGAAAHLYRRAGFRLIERRPGAPWGVPLVEERHEMELR